MQLGYYAFYLLCIVCLWVVWIFALELYVTYLQKNLYKDFLDIKFVICNDYILKEKKALLYFPWIIYFHSNAVY